MENKTLSQSAVDDKNSIENKNKNILRKRLDETIRMRDSLSKKLLDIEDKFISIDSHLKSLFSIVYPNRKEPLLQKYMSPSFNIPSKFITNFPFFVRNSKYILAIYNIGVLSKFPLKQSLPVIYTVGFKSKRLYFKHSLHPKIDDDYIFYSCRTKYNDSFLVFEIQTDDGLCICGDRNTVYKTLKSLFNNSFEFENVEDFFGINNKDVIDFVKDKFELCNRK